MAQDTTSSDHVVDLSPRATPTGPNNKTTLKLKYSNFLQRVKFSAQKAKDEAKRKRLQQRKVKGYKHNSRIVEAQQSRRHFVLDFESVYPAHNDNDDDDAEEKKGDVEPAMLQDEWTCMVVHKKQPQQQSSRSVPRSAPPPIPHEKRAEFLRRHSSSHSLKSWLSQMAKRKTPHSQEQEPAADADDEEEDVIAEPAPMSMCGNVEGMAQEIPTEYENAIRWEWCDDAGKWHTFGRSACKEIESCYSDEMERYEYDIFGRLYCIDFKEMKQYNNLKQAWNVRRNEVRVEKSKM